jgi:hypothetical protein
VDQPASPSWRASIEIPNTGKRIGFASLEQLFTFLMDLSERNGDLQLKDGFEGYDWNDHPQP